MGRLKEIFPEGMQHFDIQIIHKLFSKKIYNINVYYTFHYIKKVYSFTLGNIRCNCVIEEYL